MKAKHLHIVPLASQAMAIREQIEKLNFLVSIFSSIPQPVSHTAKAHLLMPYGIWAVPEAIRHGLNRY